MKLFVESLMGCEIFNGNIEQGMTSKGNSIILSTLVPDINNDIDIGKLSNQASSVKSRLHGSCYSSV